MGVNPDWTQYMGKDAYLSPVEGTLRFVERDTHNATHEFTGTERLLQRYEWCASEGKHDWYDVVMFDE